MSTSTVSPATAGQAKHSLVILEQQGLSSDGYRKLHDGYLADLAQAVKAGTLPDRQTFRAMLKLNAVMPEAFRLTVNYGQPLAAMIAAGKYDRKNDDITAKRSPLTGEGLVEVEACLFHFDRSISSEDAVKAIETADKQNPWTPGQIEHVLSFGTFFPEEQHKYPVVGLGSVVKINGNRNVPELWKNDAKRKLDLNWWKDDWNENYRFLGWVHFPDHRVLRTASKRRMLKRLKKTPVKEETLNSYLGMLSHGNAHKLTKLISGSRGCEG